MKHMRLRCIPMGDDSTLDYKKLLHDTLVESPVNASGASVGIIYAELERIHRIVDALEDVDHEDVLVLDDADWQFVQQRMDMVRWVRYDKAVLEFMQAIHDPLQGLPEVSAGSAQSTAG